MRIKGEFLVRKIADENVLVPVGKTVSNFNGLIMLNDMGVYIWENIDKVDNKDEMLKRILNEYEVEEDVAKSDMDEFLDRLVQANIIEI